MVKKSEEDTKVNNIYQKIRLIQSEVKELIRTEENKFQKYKFFNELQVLKLLRPLLNKHKLILFLSDDTTQPLIHEKEGKEHFIKYLKKLEIIDSESPEQRLLFNFWAAGSNVDLAKAKGSSETYAIKYMLSKFFLMPVKDEGDPDYQSREKSNNKESESDSKANYQTINKQQAESLINLFRQKTADNKERQTNFCKELDQRLTRQGIEGTTIGINFRSRLNSLTPEDYRHLCDYLTKL